jgi:hypothetical protein
MKALKLTRGKYAIVDDDIYEIVKDYKWYCSSVGYAIRNLPREYRKKQKKIYLHRLIMECKKEAIIDHIDQNKLNNQRSNLRLSNYSENRINSKLSKNNKTGFRGISFNQREGKYEVRFGKIYLGRYQDMDKAVEIYNKNLRTKLDATRNIPYNYIRESLYQEK